ncbi:hypothetical protein DX928_11195 [Bacillus swezeyi]|nr:hypothetical protein DX928_11195 [Bacillus swezeyi]
MYDIHRKPRYWVQPDQRFIEKPIRRCKKVPLNQSAAQQDNSYFFKSEANGIRFPRHMIPRFSCEPGELTRLIHHACLPFYFAKETNLHLRPSGVSIDHDAQEELQVLNFYHC